MGKNVKVDIKGLEEFQKRFEKVNRSLRDEFIEQCAKELTARFLRKVIKRTPTGDYSQEIEVTAKRNSKHHKKGDVYKKRVNPSGKMGGTLKRGWISKTQMEAASGNGKPSAPEIQAFVDSTRIQRIGDEYRIEIINPVEYASYVEYGHRQEPGRFVPELGKRLKLAWVPGKFMMTISAQEIQSMAPAFLRKKLEAKLREAFK